MELVDPTTHSNARHILNLGEKTRSLQNAR